MITLQERVHGAKPPQDWQLSKLHHVFTIRKNNKNIGMLNDNLLSLSYGRIVNKDIDTTGGLLPESFETYQIVYPGDIVLRLTDLQNDKRSIRQGLVKEKGIITSAYDAIYPTKGHDPRYWSYTLLAMDLAKYYYSMGGGVRQSVKFKDFPNDWLHIPSHETQKGIADFLDQETARIDQLIEKKQLLLSLAHARIVSRIESVLTKGLDNYSEFKPSGILWLGDIPSKWDLMPLRHLVKISTGSRDTQDRIDDAQYPFFVRSETIERIDSYALDTEAVLTSGDGAGVGKIFHHYKGKFDLHQRVYAFTNFKHVTARYFYYFLSAFFNHQMTQHSAKSTVDSVRMPFLKGMVFTVPSITEQNQITSVLDKEYLVQKNLNEKLELSIEKLKELRSSLVTAAVTGQLDIHTWRKRSMTDCRMDKVEQDMNEGTRAAC